MYWTGVNIITYGKSSGVPLNIFEQCISVGVILQAVIATLFFQNFKNLSMEEVAKLCKNDTDKIRNDFTYYMEKAKVSEKH